MKQPKLNKIKNHGLTDEAFRALKAAARSIRKTQKRYFSYDVNELELEDSYSEALCEAWRFVKNKLEEDPKSQKWSVQDWYKHIMRRVQNAILEYSKYVYLPVTLPRPVRFSLKKYAESLRIINKYVKTTRNVTDSHLYRVLFEYGCDPLKSCKICNAGYEECPLNSLSTPDRKKLYDLLWGPRRSLAFYAKWYRKSFIEWVGLLETVLTFSVTTQTQETPVTYDLEASMDLHRFRHEAESIHPDLYAVYIASLDNTDISALESERVISTPKGWDNKYIKDRFGLTDQQYREMLVTGDRVLNKMRVDAGIPRIRRRIQEKSAN